MSFAFPADRFSSQKNIQRGAAITLLLLIHALVLGVLMNTKQSPEPLSQSVREIIVSFPIFRPRPIPQKQRPSRVHARIRSSTGWRFDLPHGVIPPATQPEWSGVGHVLFGCDPAMMLNPDQSAGCSALTAARVPEEVGMPKKSRVVQTARWMYEREIKRSHVLIPCFGFYKGRQPFGAVKENNGAMIDLVCVVNGLLFGFGEPK